MQRIYTFILLTIAFFTTTSLYADVPQITTATLLRELWDMDRFCEFPSPRYYSRLFSSYDRRSTDPNVPTFLNWFANVDRGCYIRTEQNNGRVEYVMADAAGPGAITRMWCCGADGIIRIYVDDMLNPAITADFYSLLSGKISPYTAPLVQEKAMACTFYFPILFSQQCKITVESAKANLIWYQVNSRQYIDPVAVEPFSTTLMSQYATQISEAGQRILYPSDDPGFIPSATVLPISWFVPAGGTISMPLAAPTGHGGKIYRLKWKAQPANKQTLRKTLVKIDFDGIACVHAPLGDFFGSGPGLNNFSTLPLTMNRDGAMVCRWQMPFHNQAMITLQNTSNESVTVTGSIVVLPYEWTANSLLFHAKLRSQHHIPTNVLIDWNLVEIQNGRGLYVGSSLSLANPVASWWGEGDEKIYVDGESFPSHFGTGTEDYYSFGGGYLFDYTHPFYSQTRPVYVDLGHVSWFGYTSVNRFHILDVIPFNQQLRFDMEISTFNHRFFLSYDLVNYWYAEPSATDNLLPVTNPEIATCEHTPVYKIPGAIEAEQMVLKSTSGCYLVMEDMSWWGRSSWSYEHQMLIRNYQMPGRAEFSFNAGQSGWYKVTGYFSRWFRYAIGRFDVNGKTVGTDYDFYLDSQDVQPSGPIALGVFELKATDNRLGMTMVGRNPNAVNQNLAIDALLLEKVTPKQLRLRAALQGGFNFIGTIENTNDMRSHSPNQALTVIDTVQVRLYCCDAERTLAAHRTARLLNDGSVVNMDNGEVFVFPDLADADYYVAVRHRNHCQAVSALPQHFTDQVLSYDFTLNNRQYSDSTRSVLLANGWYALAAGDINQDGLVNQTDVGIWWSAAQSESLSSAVADVNLDGEVTTLDYSMIYNNSKRNRN